MRRTRIVLAASLAVLLFTTAQLSAAKRRTARQALALDPSGFVRVVDNKFFPLTPGTTFFYQGQKEGVPFSDTMFVTHKTKKIAGVTCIVVHDQVFDGNGALSEDTLDFYAQDTAGNVWYFGEDTKELDPNGNVISTEGSWLAGVNGATPGIIMEADPKKNDQYEQENAPGVAQDRAKVISLTGSATVLYGSFDDLLVTQESTPLDPKDVENKSYAAGIGFILGVAVRGGNERTELVNITVQ